MPVQHDKEITVDYDKNRMTVVEVWEGVVTLPTCDCDGGQPISATVSFVQYDGPIPTAPPLPPERC